MPWSKTLPHPIPVSPNRTILVDDERQAVAVNSNATKPILRVEEKALRREDMLQRSTIFVLFTAKTCNEDELQAAGYRFIGMR
jgi:hypothetical protein